MIPHAFYETEWDGRNKMFSNIFNQDAGVFSYWLDENFNLGRKRIRRRLCLTKEHKRSRRVCMAGPMDLQPQASIAVC